MKRWVRVGVLGCAVAICAAAHAGQSAAQASGVDELLRALGEAARAGSPDAYMRLVSPGADRAAAEAFAAEYFGAPADVALRERDRQPLDDGPAGRGYRLLVGGLFRTGDVGRLVTFEFNIQRDPGAAGQPAAAGWSIANQHRLSSIDNLHRLALDPSRAFVARDLVVSAEDVELRLARGSVFVAAAGGGPTALVLVGKGEMLFSPGPAAERGQMKLFSGSEALRAGFDACTVRLNPADLSNHLHGALVPGPVDAGELRQAQAVFASDVPRSYTLDLADLDSGSWSMLPSGGDFLAEVHTERLGALTYARTTKEPEDVTLFDRLHDRLVALYASREKLATRGPFYSEDDDATYTVVRYGVDVSFAPDRQWIEGQTHLLLRVRAPSLSTIELRLASPLVVRSASAAGLGRLGAVRVRSRDTVLVALPASVTSGTEIALTVTYAGRLPAQSTAPVPAAPPARGALVATPRVEPGYFYTSPSAWYAQAPTVQYAPATLHVTVPAPYSAVASGEPVASEAIPATAAGAPSATRFTFEARQPVPYLACLIGRLVHVEMPASPAVAGPVGTSGTSATAALPRLTVEANPEERDHAKQAGATARDVLRFYTSLVGESPYPALTLALVEASVPGGDSPAYLSVLHQQVATSRLVWRNDPAAFPDVPEFFTAHEIAHQWWGQAVGWKNYHEQWLSEGFAQYFAALYVEHAHGHAAFVAAMRRMEEWAERSSANGPVYLGGRLGQVDKTGRVFRAIVYDKGAVVLDMLRRLVGDQAFFGGVRRFYRTWRFQKAGTDDLRQAFEAESGRSLQRFFERWIYGDSLPRIKVSWQKSPADRGDELDVRIEQVGEVFDLPVTITIAYADRPAADLTIPVTEPVVERHVPAAGRIKSVTLAGDPLVAAKIVR